MTQLINIFNEKLEEVAVIEKLICKDDIDNHLISYGITDEQARIQIGYDEYIHFNDRKIVYTYKDDKYVQWIAKGLTKFLFKSIPLKDTKDRYMVTINEEEKTFSVYLVVIE